MAPPAPGVLGAPVAEARINDFVSAIGDGRAARSVTVTPYVAGRVAAIDVASGDFVAAGTPLVRLDSETEEIALDRARLTARRRRDHARARPGAAASPARSTEVQLLAERSSPPARPSSPSATPSSRSSTG